MTPRLQLQNISKHYPGVVANDDISLSVMPGEIHAVLGENGAGKSTLMKIIYGAAHADRGNILWNGAAVRIASPAAARRLGIGMVYQHFSLFETVTVAENIAVAVDEPFDLPALSARIRALSAHYGLPLEPGRLLYHLSVGERQRVEIVRCLLQNPQLLILDEPTSVLTPQAVSQLFETLRRIAGAGCSILYISHKLEEIRELCDRATVLRGGRVTGTVAPQQTTINQLAQLMVGTSLPHTRHPQAQKLPAHRPDLEVNNLTVPAEDAFGSDLHDISLNVHGGEIVGIAGVSGNGQRELLALLSGERILAKTAGTSIRLLGAAVAHLDAGQRRARGLAFVPEERLGRGAVPMLDLSENTLLTGYRRAMLWHGLIRRHRARSFAARVIERFNVKCNGSSTRAGSLSGGNLQKFIVGRELELAPKVLIVAQPTWGVDIAAAAVIRQALIDISRQGTAVLVVSEELDELFEICDRIMVMQRGRLSAAKDRANTNSGEVGLLMAGSGTPSLALPFLKGEI
jgi:simple sugar transport system ATP-binding protein